MEGASLLNNMHVLTKSDLHIENLIINKAGYTATSCGRAGRGGNTRFPTFRLERDQPTDGRTEPLIELRVHN